MLVAFFMISVVFTGCLEDVEEIEEKQSDEAKCPIISGEYEMVQLLEWRDDYVLGYWKFSDSKYDVDTGKCNVTYNIVNPNGDLNVNSDGTVYDYSAEISDSASNMIIIISDQSYNATLEDSGNITIVNINDPGYIFMYIPCTGCFDAAKTGEFIVDEEGNPPGEGSGCIDYDDENSNGLYDVGEPCYDDHSAISYNVTVDSLEDVFNSMNYEGDYYYTKEEWVIHDISEIVEIDGMLMFGVTGKAQEDGYNCGLETWYISPGESTFTPGQCLLSEKPSWHAEYVPSNDGALWAPNFHGPHTMYYTLPTSNEDSHEDTQSCIGMVTATGTAPDLVWTDYGEPILCQIEGEENNDDPEPPALDPAIFIDDDGRMYMVYGGAHIWITELNPETGEHISGDPLSWALTM